MRIESYRQPKSSFLAMEKDLGIITDLILRNDRLKKLLHYTSKDALKKPKLSDEQTYELFGKSIKLIPKVKIDPEVLNYLVISFDNFATNASNPQFRDSLLAFDIICHYDQWQLEDFQLRPYRIAAELDAMLDGQKLTGIGRLEFFGAGQQNWNDEFGGLTVFYNVIHGEEDKKHPINPADEEDIIENFNEIFNS